MNKEQESIKEKLPICSGCEQIINVNNPNIVYLRYKKKLYHENCFRLKMAKEERTSEEIIFREAPLGEQTDVGLKKHIVFDDKGVSKLSFMKAMKENQERFK